MKIQNGVRCSGICIVIGTLVLTGCEKEAWRVHTDAGIKAYQENDYRESEKEYLLAITLAEEYGYPQLSDSLLNLALLYLNVGRLSEAESLLMRAVDVWKNGDPGKSLRLRYESGIACSLTDQAALYDDLSPIVGSTNAHAVRVRAGAPRGEPQMARLYHNRGGMILLTLGRVYMGQGKFTEAEATLRMEMNLLKTSLEMAPSCLIRVLTEIGRLYTLQGKTEEADKFFKCAQNKREIQKCLSAP